MNKSERRYQELKKKALQLKTEKDRAEGALQQIKEDMEKEFGVKNLKQAKALLKKMKADAKKKDREFNRLLNKFEEQWERNDGDKG